MKVGVVVGTFDMFHIGHLNLLNNAKSRCDYLIAGVNVDNVVLRDKNKSPIITELSRFKIVEAIRCVDKVFLVEDNAVQFIKWLLDNGHNPDTYYRGYEPELSYVSAENEKISNLGVNVFFLPHTDGISSTIIRDKLNEADNMECAEKSDEKI
ncbi:MAG: adenylyltransferase/cytidyltransferase family protein [Rickettsiales bacterium]|jgi:glycerol-3-phosphate cytidylyltransferase|nr:adenylyltransferase/cytidyltransferase family protein [Rickettsiales bacterium]